jgi:Na+-driven multidrug efflux pump
MEKAAFPKTTAIQPKNLYNSKSEQSISMTRILLLSVQQQLLLLLVLTLHCDAFSSSPSRFAQKLYSPSLSVSQVWNGRRPRPSRGVDKYYFETDRRNNPHRHLFSANTPQTDSLSANNNTTTCTSTNYNWTRPTLMIAAPALVGMLADPLLSLMDTVFVGRLLGSNELAALGACTSIFHLAFNAFRATTAATTTIVSKSIQQDKNINSESTCNNTTATNTQRVTAASLQLGAVMGSVVLVVLLVGAKHMLHGMGVPAKSPLYLPAFDYLFARCWAAPAVLLLGVSEGVFRGHGDTIVPLAASFAAALLNVALDPLLMIVFRMGVRGAAIATAVAQVGALAVYAYFLIKRNMVWTPRKRTRKLREQQQLSGASTIVVTTSTTTSSTLVKTNTDNIAKDVAVSSQTIVKLDDNSSNKNNNNIIRTILGANLSMLVKQGSLLLGWAYATARATRLGAAHVAAHQIALSVWLVFALILDGAAVSAQVLMSRAYNQREHQEQQEQACNQQQDDATDNNYNTSTSNDKVMSLAKYMIKFALAQGIASMILVRALDSIVPQLFTRDPSIQNILRSVMPQLAAQQVLVSATLVMESLAAGANQFSLLAIGTSVSTAIAIWQLSLQTNVRGLWMYGIGTLFVGRLVTACVSCSIAFLPKFRLKRKSDC